MANRAPSSRGGGDKRALQHFVVVVRPRSATAEEVIGQLAARSHGVVTRRELLAAGVTAAEIKHRLATGALLREHSGVFRVGHRAPNMEARYLAAVRACGADAVLSGRAAAFLYGLLGGLSPPPEVTAPGRRRLSGVRTREARRLEAVDITRFRRIPITTVPRTLVDLAAELDAEALARACHEAGVKYGTTPGHVAAVLERRPNSRGAAKLRGVLTGDSPVLISRLEKRFFALLKASHLPLPETNRPADGRHVDCRWPDVPLTVELDGYRYHRSRHAWEQDRRREREARARGDEFRRYTWGDVYEQPDATLAELRRALAGVLQ